MSTGTKGPDRSWQIGPYRFSRYSGSFHRWRRWECNAHSRGVGNCRTPIGAFLHLRRFLKQPLEPWNG